MIRIIFIWRHHPGAKPPVVFASLLSVLLVVAGIVARPLPVRSQLTAAPEALTAIQQSIERGDFKRAAELLQGIELDRRSPLYLYYRAIAANLQLRQGDYGLAASTYAELYAAGFGAGDNRLALLDNYIQALLGRARVYTALGQDDRSRQAELTEKALADREKALALAGEALALAERGTGSREARIRAQLNWYRQHPAGVPAASLGKEILSLPPSQAQVEFWLSLAQVGAEPLPSLQQAVAAAQKLGDPLSLSWSWGALGEYYERRGALDPALAASHRAAWAAQEALDWRQLARWQWLAARIYRQGGQQQKALAAYRQAVSAVRQLRLDLAGSRVGQNLYFETIEPLLRDFLGFLLAQPNPPSPLLAEAVEVMRLNQLAELDNYLGSICEIVSSRQVAPRQGEALVYTLLLPEKAWALWQFADGSYRLAALPLAGEVLARQALDWRQQLTDRFYGDYRQGSQALYEALLRPLEAELAERQVRHLRFVQDGILRNIPMAALYDRQRQQFLIEQYAISYSLVGGEPLPDAFPRPPLVVGSSRASAAFPNPLPGVVRETERVEALLGGTRLLDGTVTPDSLAAKLRTGNYGLLHFASHSRFPGLAEEVRIQVGEAAIDLEQFEALLRGAAALQHLTLSACETASGSRYAILGMAGVGLRAGVKSVLGSLWYADDLAAAEALDDFYRQWQDGQSAAESLRQVQVEQIRQGLPPALWGTFVLVSK